MLGDLFDRHLDAVFLAAWYVVRDREVAAEVTRATFADAWSELGSMPAEEHEAWLLDCAHILAIDWLRLHDPARLDPENAAWAFPEVGRPEPPGPVMRARIVAALEMSGISTKDRYDSSRQHLAWRLAAGAATVLLVAIVAALFVKDDPSTSASPLDEAGPTTEPPTSAAIQATTTSTTAATAATTTTTTAPSTTTSERPTTTAAPATQPPQPSTTAPPATQPAPPPPDITGFSGGFFGGDDQCRGNQRMLSMWWSVSGADSARLRPEGGSWSAASVPVGFRQVCTTPGTVWTLEASNRGGTTRETLEAR